jgi:GDP-D-mannose 3',5'-epimerase
MSNRRFPAKVRQPRGTQLRVTAGANTEPVNARNSEPKNQLADIIEEIAGISVRRACKLDAPPGIRGRDSDNTFIHETYGWELSIRLADDLERKYRWIYDQLAYRGNARGGRKP